MNTFTWSSKSEHVRFSSVVTWLLSQSSHKNKKILKWDRYKVGMLEGLRDLKHRFSTYSRCNAEINNCLSLSGFKWQDRGWPSSMWCLTDNTKGKPEQHGSMRHKTWWWAEVLAPILTCLQLTVEKYVYVHLYVLSVEWFQCLGDIYWIQSFVCILFLYFFPIMPLTLPHIMRNVYTLSLFHLVVVPPLMLATFWLVSSIIFDDHFRLAGSSFFY